MFYWNFAILIVSVTVGALAYLIEREVPLAGRRMALISFVKNVCIVISVLWGGGMIIYYLTS